MTVGKISAVCWTVFVVMSVAFLPLAIAIDRISVLPGALRLPLAIGVVAVLWWGPFAYAMYLAIAVMNRGDRRLLRHGVRGSAVVLSARGTNTYIRVGGGYGSGSRLWKYRLRVSVPGRPPYETTYSICAAGFAKGQTIEVAVGRRNPKRVTFVPGARTTVWPYVPAASAPPSPRARLVEELAELGRLHGEGVLTDTEFAAAKARILDELGDDPPSGTPL